MTADSSTGPLGGDRGILDTLPDGVLVADADGVVRQANDVARQLLGAEELLGRPLAEVLPLQDLDGREWYAFTDPYEGLNIRRMQVEQAWRLPDGTETSVDDPASPALLSAHLGREVTLLREDDDGDDDGLHDGVGHFDDGPVSLLGTASVGAVADDLGAPVPTSRSDPAT